jgi:hypothetical protein
MTITPVHYANSFLNLQVFLDDVEAEAPPTPMALPEKGWAQPVLMQSPKPLTLAVNSYLLVNGGAPAKSYYGKFGSALKTAQFIQAKIKRLDGAIETLSVLYSDISYALIAPFWGKGYPEECQLALQLWDRLGFGPPDVKALCKEDGSIGLDCNGFVGGYLERRQKPAQWRRSQGSMTSSTINELMRLPGTTLNSLADFSPPESGSLIMAICDPSTGVIRDHGDTPVGHVVITQPGTAIKRGDGAIEVTVAESTGHVGVTTSTYAVLSETKLKAAGTIFRVQRGSKKGRPEEFESFKIRRLD